MTATAVLPYSALRAAGRTPLATVLPLPTPYALSIETTNRCNFKCRMCPVSHPDWAEKSGGPTWLDVADVDRLYSDLEGMGRLKTLRFYGVGEPLLDANLPWYIAEAKRRDIAERTEVTTNGSALVEFRARNLIDSGLDYLRVSIYGMTAARQRDVTQSSVSPERIHQNVRRFRELRDASGSATPYLHVKMLDGDPEEVRFLHDLYDGVADEVQVDPLHDWDSYGLQQIGPPRKRVCPLPFYSLSIQANGDVAACCVDWNKATVCGNIHQESIADIWRGERLRAFRRMHLEGRRGECPSCANCTFLETVPDDLDGVAPGDFGRLVGAG